MMTPADPITELDARFSDPAAVATPWPDARRVIDKAELFWISTVRADGRPHVTPLPAVWQDGALHFCTGAEEQKAVNLARNAHCTLTTGRTHGGGSLRVFDDGADGGGQALLERCRVVGVVVHQQAGLAVDDDLRDATDGTRDYRCPTGERFDDGHG